MLTREALEAGLPLAERLDANKAILVAVPGSHLDVLNRATRATSLFVIPQSDGSIQPDIENIVFIANTKNDQLGYSDHDICMDDLSEKCADAVRGHIAFARGTVTPAVLDMVEKVTTAQQNAANVSALLGMEVSIWNPPLPLTNASFAESLQDYNGVSFQEPRFVFNLPAQSYEELLTLMETGKSSVDEDIRLWAATKGANFLLDVWAVMFQNAVKRDGQVRSFYGMTAEGPEAADTALAVFLLSRRLQQDPLEGTGMGLSEYTAAMADFRDQAALRLLVAVGELERDRKAGRLVRQIYDKTTVVNGPVYKEWIAAGGSNEVLFGNMLSNAPLYTTEQLTGNAQNLVSFWHRHETATAMAESQQKFNRGIAALRKAFVQQMNELADAKETDATSATLALRLFEEQLENVTARDFEDLYSLCLRLVCRSRFHQTDAEHILASGERISREFPNIDLREAFAMATIEYVTRWVCTMFKVSQA